MTFDDADERSRPVETWRVVEFNEWRSLSGPGFLMLPQKLCAERWRLVCNLCRRAHPDVYSESDRPAHETLRELWLEHVDREHANAG